MPLLPPLRPLPPQSSLLRPAWSAAAGQLSHRRRGGLPAAALARRSHSDSPAADGAPPPATESNGPTDHAQHATTARTKRVKNPYRNVKFPREPKPNGDAAAAAAAAADSVATKVKPPAGSVRRKPGGKQKGKGVRPAGGQRPGQPGYNPRKKELKKKPKDIRNERRIRRLLEQPDIVWESKSVTGAPNRLLRLAQMASPLRVAAERVGGPRLGAITRDTIVDDETWQRLKQQVAEIGQEKTDAVEEVKPEAHESLGNRKLNEKNPQKRKEKRVSYRPLVATREKPDPINVRERLREAIGGIRSRISAEIEDHSQPSRYRQNDQPVTKSLHDQRLDELESLLFQAFQRLRELKGYRTSEDDTSLTLGLSSDVASMQDQTWNLGSPVMAGINGPVDPGKIPEDIAQPRRYLSRDPSRPLPHLTEQAIPSELYGPRKSVTSGQPEQRGRQRSIVDDVLGDGPKEHQLEASTGNAEESAEPSENRTGSLVDEILTASAVAHRKKQAPLLSELFPELAHSSQKGQRPAPQEREVPKLNLDLQVPNPEGRSKLVERKAWTTQRMQELYVKDIVVVQLSGLSRNLGEADLKRLVPQSSKYIEGWSDPDFIKVIPVREEDTLERLDQYYVLFRNVRAARDFQEHVHRLHVTTKKHSASSLLSALPPPPGFLNDHGVDVHAALQSYTIGPPASDKIYCNIVPYPYPRKLHQLLARGGYEHIAGPANAIGAPDAQHPDPAAYYSVAKVLLWFDGPQPSFSEVRRTIARDGKDRGLPWLVVGGTNSADGVVRLNSNEWRLTGSQERKVPPRYIVSLESKGEAYRFAGRWQCSPFKFNTEGRYEKGEGPPKARAEVLW